MTTPQAGSGRMPLDANPSAAQVRARFDELDANLPEHYDHGAWDAQVIAWFLVQEVRDALLASERPAAPAPRDPKVIRAEYVEAIKLEAKGPCPICGRKRWEHRAKCPEWNNPAPAPPPEERRDEMDRIVMEDTPETLALWEKAKALAAQLPPTPSGVAAYEAMVRATRPASPPPPEEREADWWQARIPGEGGAGNTNWVDFDHPSLRATWVKAMRSLGHAVEERDLYASPAPRATPASEGSEVTEAMVEAFSLAPLCDAGKVYEHHCAEECDNGIRIGLTAALRAGGQREASEPKFMRPSFAAIAVLESVRDGTYARDAAEDPSAAAEAVNEALAWLKGLSA